jgi:hypothetical protein
LKTHADYEIRIGGNNMEKMKTMNKTIFMVMPFEDKIANNLYAHSTKPVIESLGFRILRGDEIFSANSVFDDIVAAIERSLIVIVDISTKNANCFYELGMAHTLKRSRTIIITHEAYDEAPFDISHFRIIQYENSISGKTEYENTLRKTVASMLTGVPEIYADEFVFLESVLKAAGKEYSFLVLETLEKAKRPIVSAETVDVEGRFPSFPDKFVGKAHGGEILEYLKPFMDNGYINLRGKILSLTGKGQAFSEFLTKQGYLVYRFNDQVFVDGYVPFDKLVKQKYNLTLQDKKEDTKRED